MKSIIKNSTRNNQGFTIVELLIVVVVIAILAAITIVAYNGITAQANDSARQTDASTVGKQLELRLVSTGSYGHGENYPSDRAALLDIYGLSVMSDQIMVCHQEDHDASGYDDCWDEQNWDKNKVFFTAWGDNEGPGVAYWSNADQEWKMRSYIAEGEIQEGTYSESQGPVGGSGGATYT